MKKTTIVILVFIALIAIGTTFLVLNHKHSTKNDDSTQSSKELTITNVTIKEDDGVYAELSNGEQRKIAAFVPFEDGNFTEVRTYQSYKISPNGRHIAISGYGFEEEVTEVYDVETDTLHKDELIYGHAKAWTEAGLLEIEACDLSGEVCVEKVSVNASTPWITKQLPGNSPNSNYQTKEDPKSGITFSYPVSTNFDYIKLTEWPPRFVNAVDPIKCELDEQTQAMSVATSGEMIINDNTYCIWETSEGAAGSVYKSYQITYPMQNQFFTMSFTAQYPNCANYPEPEMRDCEEEQEGFPLSFLVDRVAQSAKLPNR